jgi:YD repeat-containing protein
MARTAWKCVFFCLILLICSIYFQVVSSAVNDITYIYDELGRLVAVVDPSGDTAIYSYDAVGNLLSITRQSSSLVAVIEFTPDGGAVGSNVTIYGTGFSTMPGQNAVTFNGTAATVTSSTATQITTSVPSEATTGLIAVTTPAGTASSAIALTVASSSNAPTISSFTPTAGPVGTSVTISGTNFETAPTSNKVKLNNVSSINTAATSSSITTIVPSRTAAGRISVTTSAGAVLSSGDFFVTPHPFNGSHVDFADRMAIGDTKTISVSTSGKIAMVVFDGSLGQKVSFKGTSNSMHPANLYVYKPDGTLLTSMGPFIFNTPFIDTQTLPLTGTYTFLVDPDGSNTGSMSLTLHNVTHLTNPIEIDGSQVATTITTPGQNATLTFSGTANQKISFMCTASTIAKTAVRLINPAGGYYFQPTIFTGAKLVAVHTLPATGTYTLELDPELANTGALTMRLYNAPDAGGPITTDGTSAAINIMVPGQRAVYTFDGTAGQKVSLRSTNVSNVLGLIAIKKPDGSNLASIGQLISGNRFIEPVILPVTGTYTVLVDPEEESLCSGTLNLYDVVDFLGGILTIGGSSASVTLSTPGQSGYFEFSGTAGQQVTVRVTGNNIASVNVGLIKPDGTTLTWKASSASSFNLTTQTLPTTGTYVISINPPSTNTGSLSVSVTSP